MKKSNWLKLSILTIFSRVLGLTRDVLCAHVFGASAEFDAFVVAFQIPNFMRRLFAEGAMAQAFVPLYNSIPVKQQKNFASITMTLMLLFTSALVLLAWFSGKALICLYAPGYSNSGQLTMAINMLKYTMPYITAISVVTICSGINNSHNRFVLTGAIPIILNIVLIAAAYLTQKIMFLAYGVFIAGFLQAIIMIAYTWRFIGRVQFSFADKNAKKLMQLMAMGALAAIIAQLGVMLDTFLASWLDAGSVSSIYFAQRLVFLPIGIIAVAIATVLTPALSKLAADNSAFNLKLKWGCNLIWLITWPACFGLMLLSPMIVRIIFNHGAFGTVSSVLTSNIVFVMAIGLPAFMINKVLISALYAKKQARLAVSIMLKCLLFNVLTGVLAMLFLQQIGIVLASATTAWLQMLLLSRIASVDFFSWHEPISALCMVATLVCLQGLLAYLPVSLQLFVFISVGIIFYEFCLRFSKKSLFREVLSYE